MMHNCSLNMVPKKNEMVAEMKLLIGSICRPVVRHAYLVLRLLEYILSNHC
jgi:hypothetical protein